MTAFRETLAADLARLRPTTTKPDAGVFVALFNPRSWPVLSVRVAAMLYARPYTKPLAMVVSWLATFLFGFECTPRCKIGKGLLIPHSHGTVIGAAELGENVTVFQGVTLGAKFADMGFSAAQRPKIGSNVVLGAGAKILGGITVGDGAVVAANSLVLEDVPPHAKVMGVPARLYE